jgi:RNA polymerase sigma factor (sigma-70 family)
VQENEPVLPPFERVLDLHGPAIFRFCVVRAGRQHAEDCFQETMIAALGNYERVRDPAAIRSWLFSIAVRKVIDHRRAHSRESAALRDLAALAPGAHEDRELPAGDLWGRVFALPEKQRQAITLRYLGDLTHREIAQVMQISEPAARRNVFEGLKQLRRETSR